MNKLRLLRFADHLLNVWEIKKIKDITLVNTDNIKVKLYFRYKFRDYWYNVLCTQNENENITVHVYDNELIYRYNYSKHARFSSWGGFTNRLDKELKS